MPGIDLGRACIHIWNYALLDLDEAYEINRLQFHAARIEAGVDARRPSRFSVLAEPTYEISEEFVDRVYESHIPFMQRAVEACTQRAEATGARDPYLWFMLGLARSMNLEDDASIRFVATFSRRVPHLDDESDEEEEGGR